MGGLLHLFDFSHSAAPNGRVFSHKNEDDAYLEAPRNSLELQLQSSQTYFDLRDVLYSYEDDDEVWFQRSCYPIGESMKTLINDEISKRPNTTSHSTPSIVAKLMGVDALPMNASSIPGPVQRKAYPQNVDSSGNERNTRDSIVQHSANSGRSSLLESESVQYDRDAKRWGPWQRLEKPKRREHPQEEELQKFKKEFEAWQAARSKECSKIIAPGTAQLLSQKSLDKENTSVYANVKGVSAVTPTEPKNLKHKSYDSTHHRHKSEPIPGYQDKNLGSRSRSRGRDWQHFSLIEYDQKQGGAPTRIVILKPGPQRIGGDYEETATTSSGTMEDRGSIEDFLEEVKERLKYELQGRALKRSSTVRGSGIETPFSEKPWDPKQMSWHRTKHGRAGANTSRERSLLRSESTKSHRSDAQFDGPNSPEFMSRETRKFLTSRLRNVLKTETDVKLPESFGSHSRLSVSESDRRLKQAGASNHSYRDIANDDQDMKTRSFRSDDNNDDQAVGSPRNLIRSLSAPVSGTSFGKLLLEDRPVLGGGQIRRKHEALDSVSEDSGRRKDRFNFRKKVSSIRSTLRGRLFGKKIQSMMESNSVEHEFVRDFTNGQRVWSLWERNDNSTEVPPSPASVCSSTPEELWSGVDCVSPVSTPEATIEYDNIVSQAFREISSNLSDLRRQLNELDSELQEDESIKQEAAEDEAGAIDLENPAKAYVTDVLVASGLYDGSSEKPLTRWDPLAKPLSKSVFEKTEERHRMSERKNEEETKITGEKDWINRKLLFDLLNEALASVLGPPVTKSKLWKKLIWNSASANLKGKKLLETVWQMMSECLNPAREGCYYSVESMVAQDLESSPWPGLIDEEMNALGRDVECLVIMELLEEIVKDMQPLRVCG